MKPFLLVVAAALVVGAWAEVEQGEPVPLEQRGLLPAREPFTLVDYHYHSHTFRESRDADATLLENMKHSYEVHKSFYVDPNADEDDPNPPMKDCLLSGDIPSFVELTINPDRDHPEHPASISDEERAVLEGAVHKMREREGLLDDTMRLNHGFITRGGPFKSVQEIRRALHERRTREVADEVAERARKRRERDLLGGEL